MYSTLRAMDSVLSWLCIAIMGILASLVIVAVVLRYLFGISIIQMEEMICVLFAATTFLGTALAVREKSHITIPAITQSLTPAAQRMFRIVSMSGVIAVSATVFWTSIRWIASIGGTDSLSLQIPCGYYYVLVPLSFALVIFYSVIDMVSLFVPIPEAEKGYVADADIVDFGPAVGDGGLEAGAENEGVAR